MSTVPEKETTSDQPPPYGAIHQQPPPQVVYPPPAPQGAVVTTTVVAQQVPPGVPVLLPMVYGPHPINMTCPHCQASIVTSTVYEPGMMTWLLCGGIALVGFWCGCCLIPFCMNEFQDCKHSCPNCKNFLGAFRRM